MEENGYITVNVRTAGGALPVENAVVTVKDSGGAILAVFFTDRDGKTPRLKVLAPPRANSESRSLPQKQQVLYSTYKAQLHG